MKVNKLLHILDKLKGYQLVHQQYEIIVEIISKKFAHVRELVESCNQCCSNFKMNQYVLSKVQSTRFSKKLHNQLAEFPKTCSGSIYNWILKPLENIIINDWYVRISKFKTCFKYLWLSEEPIPAPFPEKYKSTLNKRFTVEFGMFISWFHLLQTLNVCLCLTWPKAINFLGKNQSTLQYN